MSWIRDMLLHNSYATVHTIYECIENMYNNYIVILSDVRLFSV